jgi:hypothetical protein
VVDGGEPQQFKEKFSNWINKPIPTDFTRSNSIGSRIAATQKQEKINIKALHKTPATTPKKVVPLEEITDSKIQVPFLFHLAQTGRFTESKTSKRSQYRSLNMAPFTVEIRT